MKDNKPDGAWSEQQELAFEQQGLAREFAAKQSAEQQFAIGRQKTVARLNQLFNSPPAQKPATRAKKGGR